MFRPFEPEFGPDREDFPHALRRRTDVAYDRRETDPVTPGLDTLRAAMFTRVSQAPPATISQLVVFRARSLSEDPALATILIADIDGPTSALAQRP
eukprot:14685035-Alexandrium_andersonii.AAC.1